MAHAGDRATRVRGALDAVPQELWSSGLGGEPRALQRGAQASRVGRGLARAAPSELVRQPRCTV